MRVAQPIRGPYAGWRTRLAPIAAAAVLTACVLQSSPTPAATPTPGPSSAGPSASASIGASATAEPSPSDGGRLRLPAPAGTDPTPITYSVKVEVTAGASGQLVVVVTNHGDAIVPELVLRWPTTVRDTIFLAPFAPSQQRIREGGDPLVQDWTKWVDGPGENGEPAGTTSLGWGPLLVGGTLTIPILANRVAPGPIAFDMQILSGESLLGLGPNGAPAWFEVDIP
ncbi:MAG: hypothetical protein ACXWMB_00275 [Candidatus Limnocylindria bacterium]